MKPPASKKRRRSTPSPANDGHPLVLAVLQAVWLATAKRPQPYYVSVATLRLPPDIELNDTAIMLAALSGWLTVGGNPPHSVAITSEGLKLLKERGVA
jgi:hypothetical protein